MRKSLIFFFIFISFKVSAQPDKFGNWMGYWGNFKLHSNINIHNEIQYRNYNLIGDLNQLLIRNGIGYSFKNNNANLLLGHAFVLSEPYINGSLKKTQTKEHRIYQQFIAKQEFGRLLLMHRYRFEQRFLENNFKLRFRYFSGFYLPLNNKQIVKNTVYLALINEIFINTKSNVFDRNRLSGTIGFAFTDNLKLEIGAMTQFLENSKTTQLQISLFNNIAFKQHYKNK
jgi:hypothetical protein